MEIVSSDGMTGDLHVLRMSCANLAAPKITRRISQSPLELLLRPQAVDSHREVGGIALQCPTRLAQPSIRV